MVSGCLTLARIQRKRAWVRQSSSTQAFLVDSVAGFLTEQIDLTQKAVAARVQGFAIYAGIQPMLNAAAIEPDLQAGGCHVTLVVDGCLFIRLNGTIAAADGYRAAAQVCHKFRHQCRCPVPGGLQRRQPAGHFLISYLDADFDLPGCQKWRIGVGCLFLQIGHQLAETHLGPSGGRLQSFQLTLGAADPDTGPGFVADAPLPLIKSGMHSAINGQILMDHLPLFFCGHDKKFFDSLQCSTVLMILP